MHIKMQFQYSLLRRLASYKVCLCFVLSVTVCTVRYVCLFHGDQIFVDFVSFLSTIIVTGFEKTRLPRTNTNI